MQVGAGGGAHWHCMLGVRAAESSSRAFAPLFASYPPAREQRQAVLVRRRPHARVVERASGLRGRSSHGAASRRVSRFERGSIGARAQALDGRRQRVGHLDAAHLGRSHRRGLCGDRRPLVAGERQPSRRATMPFISPTSTSIRRWPSRMRSSSRSERSRAARSALSPRWISSAGARARRAAPAAPCSARRTAARSRRPPARPRRAGAAGPRRFAAARAPRPRRRSAVAAGARSRPGSRGRGRAGAPRPRRAAAARRTRAA